MTTIINRQTVRMYVPKAPIVSIMRFTQSIITAFRGGSLPDDSDDDDDKHWWWWWSIWVWWSIYNDAWWKNKVFTLQITIPIIYQVNHTHQHKRIKQSLSSFPSSSLLYTCDSWHKGDCQSHNIDSELKLKELPDVIEYTTPPHHGLDDRTEVIIQNHYVGRLLGHC